MPGRKLRLDALVRVSRVDDREDLRSPDQQREIIDRWVEANGAVIVSEHPSLDVSGKTMKRADVDAALGRIRAGETDGVIVAWLDRFSRAPVDEALRVFNDIQAAGGQVVAADMAGFDPRDPTGELALTVMLGVNRYQWRRIAERYDITRRDAVREGKSLGGAPFGYRFRDPTRRSKRLVVDSRLLVVEELRPVVVGLFERKAGGATWLELARWLDDVAPKPPGIKWHRNSVRSIIKSRTYLGEIRHGEHHNPEAHEAIVGPALWRRAQPAPGRRTPRGTYLLTGLVRCAGCGRRMKGGSLGAYRGNKRIYCCDNRSCPERSTVIALNLDAEVVRQFLDRLEDFHLRAIDDAGLGKARTEVERLTGEVERLAMVTPRHPAAVRAHQVALAEVEGQLEVAEDDLHRRTSAAALGSTNVVELRKVWRDLTLGEQRSLLGAGLDCVLVRRASSRTAHLPVSDRILVLTTGEAPALLRDNGRSDVERRWTWDDRSRTPVTSA